MSETSIHYQSTTSFDHLPAYRSALERHAEKILLPSTKAIFHGLPESIYDGKLPGQILDYPYLKHLIQDAALEACVQAESSGVDAFIIGSFSEPLLKASRSAVDISVLSLPESSLLTACSLAERIALITLSSAQTKRVEEIVERHGLQKRVVGCFDLGGAFSEKAMEAAINKPEAVVEAFKKAATAAIKAGADLVIPAEGVLNEVIFFSGLRKVERATVMDCVGVTLLHAEFMVNARRKLGLDPARQWSYPRPPTDWTDALRATTGRLKPRS